MVVACLKCIGVRLQGMPELLKKYQEYVCEMLQCGQAVVDKAHTHISYREWFLIHHCSGGIFWVVMNGAARYQKTS